MPVYRNGLSLLMMLISMFFIGSIISPGHEFVLKNYIYINVFFGDTHIFFLAYQPKTKKKTRLFAILDKNKKDKHHPFIITQSCLQSVHWWYEDRLFILLNWIKKLFLYNFNHLFRWAFFFLSLFVWLTKRNNHFRWPLNWKHICINAKII